MNGRFEALTPARLAQRLAAELDARAPAHRLTVCVDGFPALGPAALAERIAQELQVMNRPVIVLRDVDFLRNASVRLEYGRTDVESRLHGWLEVNAIEREVLGPLRASGNGMYLPSLRDPRANRATRASRRQAADNAIILFSGSFLLGQLTFDTVVHVSAKPATLRRRTAEHDEWLLQAQEIYAREQRPDAVADHLITMDDPRHPALLTRRSASRR